MSAAPSPDTHAGLMDRIYRPQRHFYDLTRKYYLLGRDRLIAGLALRPGATLIEVGCGTGRNLIAIAKAYPQARLYGLDASEAMLETARLKIARAGLEHRIAVRHALAEQLSPHAFGLTSFDHVLFSYSLSMIPGWQGALEAGVTALSENGQWHVVDFADFQGLGFLGRAAITAWLRPFHVSPRVEFLRTLEGLKGAIGDLTLITGRYAFIFRSLTKANWKVSPSALWRRDHSFLIKP
jgi:S-adenosylmethionine-diacylgycerolhomoserine-N-methlytransferase